MIYTYKIVSIDKVVDGDTLHATIDIGFDLLKKVNIRLSGVDTPEKRRTPVEGEKEAGLKALGFMKFLIEEATRDEAHWLVLDSTDYKRGKFGRVLGVVKAYQLVEGKDGSAIIEATNINYEMRKWVHFNWPLGEKEYGAIPWDEEEE